MPVLEQLTRKWRFVQALMKPPKYTLEDFELNLNTDIAAQLPKA
jgi:hypothetical protein